MNSRIHRLKRPWVSIGVALALLAPAFVVAAPAGAQLAPPWDGNPISAGLGPTYGEEWCAPAAGENVPQTPPLAVIPYAAIGCTLDQILAEGAEAGIPNRMSYSVIGQSVLGRDIYGVVVNALETPEQQRDYDRWREIREIMTTDPAGAQALLASWGDEVKIPIFIEGNIHGGEREGTDAMMQVFRDLVTTPYGEHPVVDAVLDHTILIVIPTTNPDGRVAGTRANANGFDMNRDLMVQSQPEIRINTAFQQEWLAPVGLFMHGYVNPTLFDGLTKPHNPGLEYDLFLYWNQRRLDANEAAFAAIGQGVTRPVNQWNTNANSNPAQGPTGPPYAEGWDDWGPFYTQTYAAFFGVDGSTLEMCSNAACGGRFGSKRAQYLGFYSSADYWIANRNAILHDQVEIFRRAVTDAERRNCCDDPLIAGRDFTEDQHNWMVEYPTAYVIPFDGGPAGQPAAVDAQRSDAEANRLVQWLLDNGIQVRRANQAFTWNGETFAKKSYVVWMNQAMRGLALTILSAGQDISARITQLYAPPGAWSHGFLWGADVIEVPRGDESFAPTTVPVVSVNELQGGVRGGGRSDWYSAALGGVSEVRAVYELLGAGVQGEVAEEPFTSTTGGDMPAGSLIFPNDAATVAALDSAGKAAGIYFERNRGAKPPTTMLSEAPKVAVLGNGAAAPRNDTVWTLNQIFGSNAQFVSMTTGANSIQNAPENPLLEFDVIYNTGQNWPANATSQARLTEFFEGGGGYIATSQSATGFTFLNNSVPALLDGTLTQGTSGAGGGIAVWSNDGIDGPLTGGYPSQDTLYLPSNVTWFSSVPADASVAGRYLPSVTDLFLAGLWRNRNEAAAGAPVIVHGETTVGSRYLGLSTNPFSRGDAEREWALIGQAAFWSNLTDEA